MTNERSPAGFTLIEIIIVMAIISLLAGTVVPLASATLRAERVERATSEIEEISTALDAYYYDRGAFPTALDASDFLGVYLLAGVDKGRIRDEWASGYYRSSRQTNPDRFHVWSVGENGVNDGMSSEDFVVTVEGRAAGDRRTRQRLNVIAGALANHIANGGTLSGTWSTDRAAMSLGSDYQTDGYGTDFRIDATTREVTSAGADRSFSTADDLGI